MSRSSEISIIGLYGYDNTLFDLLTLPEGLNKETLVNNICFQLAELEILYPNPVVLKQLIGVWSSTCQYEWNKLYQTMLLEYNPLDNYDRTETRTFTSQGSGNSAAGGSDSISGTEQNSATGTQNGKIAGFNASPSLVDHDKDESSTTGSRSNSGTTTYGKTNTESFSKTDSETIKSKGNIGVTTSQQMIEQERDISKFNIYNIITDEFKMRFCVLVY